MPSGESEVAPLGAFRGGVAAVQYSGVESRPDAVEGMEQSKGETLRRLPTRTAGGKTLTVKAAPKRSSSSQSFIHSVQKAAAPPYASSYATQEARDRRGLQHAAAAPEQHQKSEKPQAQPQAGSLFSPSVPPNLASGGAASTPHSKVAALDAHDYIPAPTSFQAEMTEFGSKQPKSVPIPAARKTAPPMAKAEAFPSTCAPTLQGPSCAPSVLRSERLSAPAPHSSIDPSFSSPSATPAEAGKQGQFPVHDPVLPTAKDITEAIRLQAMWRGHEVRTWVQAASIVRSMKWDFTAGTTKTTNRANAKPSHSGGLNSVPSGLSQSNAKQGGAPVDSRTVSQLPGSVSRRQIGTLPTTAEERLLGKPNHKRIGVQEAKPSNEVPLPALESLTIGHIKKQPAGQGQPGATRATDESRHQASAKSEQAMAAAPSEEGPRGKQRVGEQPMTESPQLGVPLTTTKGSCGAFTGTPEAEQHPLPHGTGELYSSSHARQSALAQAEYNGDGKQSSTETAAADNGGLFQHDTARGNLEGENKEGDSPQAPRLSQGLAQGRSHHVEDTGGSNAASEQEASYDITASRELPTRTPKTAIVSLAEPCVQHPEPLDSSSPKRNKRHVARSVAPFLPFVGRPTKAAQHTQDRESEHAETNADSNQQSIEPKSNGAVSVLGRRVSLALRNAYSIYLMGQSPFWEGASPWRCAMLIPSLVLWHQQEDNRLFNGKGEMVYRMLRWDG
ncbi:LOW QUALITY PROTEIN: uncharacterized protein EMH_0042050 [Eimeria mitis]|uniref:Uncharacterized protein n=1 Tax=Eimeria mitis TaxID=44415 RepID=U6JT26_9EIME|nr:LOW QUALITY PROTEIN: uncharacterized protein EMH_0042050 [Eimeria mitis]CDJ28569.1 hypothetical protein, conserved [Eimeria mitis]